MMQLDQQSRWQSWMRMLAVDIQSVPESASAWCQAAIDGGTSLAAEPKVTFLNVGRSNENTD